jgi:predicted dehydrogenase/diketogulonate reductase-like aldo/keto reductase
LKRFNSFTAATAHLEPPMTLINIGILGAARIAATSMIPAIRKTQQLRLEAIAARDHAHAQHFATQHRIPRTHHGYDALLQDPDIQIVYNLLPNSEHARWTIRALEAGKHVICEKPLTKTASEAQAIASASASNDRLVIEAFTHRFHPQISTALDLIRAGVISELRSVHASFSFVLQRPNDIPWDAALGGGALLDIGCYGVNVVRLIAGREPTRVVAWADLTPTGVERSLYGRLEFGPQESGVALQASVDCSFVQTFRQRVELIGEASTLVILEPFLPGARFGKRHGTNPPTLPVNGQQLITPAADAYQLMLEDFADAIAQHRALRGRRGASMRDACPARRCPGRTAPRHQARITTGARMKYGRIHGVNTPVSRLVMGVDNQTTLESAAPIFDDWFERGGNAFDTAWQYGKGTCEPVFGAWMASRGVREQVVVIAKGAHTPNCNPDAMTAQLMESLERQRSDHVDVYLLHRDNPDIPVGEFVDVLNNHFHSGRIRAFGGSNWSLDRLRAANAYAAQHGLEPFRVVSNQFSLARMIEAPWAGCQDTDQTMQSWLEQTGTTLLPWSSQARGFFVRADPADHSDEQLVRCWYSDDNFARLQRARTLAAKRGVDAIHVALAYVLQQAFTTFPLIGPRTTAETASSVRVLELQLSPDELRWLADGTV